jgi:hypothetical protein
MKREGLIIYAASRSSDYRPIVDEIGDEQFSRSMLSEMGASLEMAEAGELLGRELSKAPGVRAQFAKLPLSMVLSDIPTIAAKDNFGRQMYLFVVSASRRDRFASIAALALHVSEKHGSNIGQFVIGEQLRGKTPRPNPNFEGKRPDPVHALERISISPFALIAIAVVEIIQVALLIGIFILMWGGSPEKVNEPVHRGGVQGPR